MPTTTIAAHKMIERAAIHCKCPTCGSSIAKKICVSLETNTLQINGISIKLSPALAEIAYVLEQAFPGTVPNRILVSKTRPITDQSTGPDVLVRTYISHLRRILKDTPLSVETTGAGYRFALL